MNSISVDRFRDNLKNFVEQVVSQHLPLKVTRRNGEGFAVLSAGDWEREQETLYVLQNNDLMKKSPLPPHPIRITHMRPPLVNRH